MIVDEVSRTGSTLNIAAHLFRLAFPDAEAIVGTYFWHPEEPPLMLEGESVLTSLPVWYDPNTLTGRGIGGIDEKYFRNRYEYYSHKLVDNPNVNVRKLRTQAFSAPVYSAPLLESDGSIMSLIKEKKTLELGQDLKKMHQQFKNKRLFFDPPVRWLDYIPDRFMKSLEEQGVKLITEDADSSEITKIRKDPLFYLNFIKEIKGCL